MINYKKNITLLNKIFKRDIILQEDNILHHL